MELFYDGSNEKYIEEIQKWLQVESRSQRRQWIILEARSPGAYKCLRNSGMVNLPCTKTLRSYLGSSTIDVGVTDIVKESMKAKMEVGMWYM